MIKKKTEQVIIVPKDLDEAAVFLKHISEREDEIRKIQADANEKIGNLKISARHRIKKHEEVISELGKGIYAFAEANRKQLLKDAKAGVVKLVTGFLEWRITRKVAVIRNAKAVLDMLRKTKAKCFKRFLREKTVVTYEIDREAMTKNAEDAEKIKGVSITKFEMFVIKPEGTENEIVVIKKPVS